MNRLIQVGAGLVLLFAFGASRSMEPLNPIDRSTLVGIWEATDKSYGNSLRLLVEQGTALRGALAIAQVAPESGTHVFAIESVSIVSDGSISFEGVDQAAGLKVQATGRGVASGSRGMMTLVLRFSATGSNTLWGIVIEPGDVTFVRGDGTLMARVAEAAARAKELLRAPPSAPQ